MNAARSTQHAARSTLFALFLLLGLLMPLSASASRSQLILASNVVVYSRSFQPDVQYTVETTDLQGGADTALYVFRKVGGDWVFMATNDNWGGALRSQILYSYSSGGSIWDNEHLIVMVSALGWPTGTADLRVSGVTIANDAAVGGYRYSSSSFTRAWLDTLHVVPQPDGSTFPFALAVDVAWPNSMPPQLYIDGGAAGATRGDVDLTHDFYYFGTPIWIEQGASSLVHRSGLARAYFNDYADADGDGVGNLLEAQLGSCVGPGSCTWAPNPDDSDRDGLTDYEELFGYVGSASLFYDDLAFPRYGATIRQKDIFVEVDWMNGTNAVNRSQSPLLDSSRSDFDSVAEWYDIMTAPFDVAPHDQIGNPSGMAGLRVHIDHGIWGAVGMSERDAADHGWPLDPRPHDDGIGRAVIARCSGANITGFVEVRANGLTVGPTALINDTSAECANAIRASAQAAAALLSPSMPIAELSETTPGSNVTEITFAPSNGGNFIDWSVLGPAGIVTSELESAESLRDRAFVSSAFFRPERRGRYRFALLASGAGQAQPAWLTSSPSPHTFAHELGHTVGLGHFGHSAWHTGSMNGSLGDDPELNCLPHYYSLMNYAYGADLGRFEANTSWVTVNPAAIRERWSDIAHPEIDPATFGANPWRLVHTLASGGAVDWNLDGVASTSSSFARVPLRGATRRGCGLMDVRRQELSTSAIVGAVDLVKVGNRLYAVYAVRNGTWNGRAIGDVRYRHAQLASGVANHSCSGTDEIAFGDCLTWSAEVSLGLTTTTGVSVVAWPNAGEPELFIGVAAPGTPNDFVRVRAYSQTTSGSLTQLASYANSSWTTTHQPELGVFIADAASAGYTARVGVTRSRLDQSFEVLLYTHGTGWATSDLQLTPLRDETGAVIPGTGPPTVFTWPNVWYAFPLATNARTCAVLPFTNTAMRFFCMDPVTRRWSDETTSFFANRGRGSDANDVCAGFPHEVGYFGPGGRCTPRVIAPVGVAYRRQRSSSGNMAANQAGNLVTAWRRSDNNLAFVYWSNSMTATTPPWNGGLEFNEQWDWYVRNEWARSFQDSNAAPTSIALYEDAFTGGMFGLYARQEDGKPASLQFMPFADGAFDADLRVGSDFDVMEDYVCRNLRVTTMTQPRFAAPRMCYNEDFTNFVSGALGSQAVRSFGTRRGLIGPHRGVLPRRR
jgi:hypothetical protein